MSRLHKPKAGLWVRLCVLVVYPIDTLLFRIRWRGLDRIPPPDGGGLIVAANHVSHIDTLLMARLVWQAGRVPRFMVKSPVFGWRWWAGSSVAPARSRSTAELRTPRTRCTMPWRR